MTPGKAWWQECVTWLVTIRKLIDVSAAVQVTFPFIQAANPSVEQCYSHLGVNLPTLTNPIWNPLIHVPTGLSL